MRLTFIPVLVGSLIPVALAVYSDEAYQTDYHLALLGIPQQHTTFFHRPQSASKASLLYTLSEKNILGAVNPKDGALVWRESLSSPSNSNSSGFLRAGEDETTVVSAFGGEVRAWDALDGKLAWGNEFDDGSIRDLEVIELLDGKAGRSAKDVVILSGGAKGVVRRLNGENGDVLWEHKDESGDIPFQVSTSALSIYYVSFQSTLLKGLKIKVTSLDPLSGRPAGQYLLSSDGDISSPDSVLFVGANAASPIIAWTDKSHKVVKVNVLGSKHTTTINVASSNGEEVEQISVHAPHSIKAMPHFLVHYQTVKNHWAEVYHIDLAGSSISKAYDIPKLGGRGTFSTSTQDANVYFTRTTEDEIILVSSASHGILARWPIGPASQDSALRYSYPVHAVSEVVARPGSNYAVRSALALSGGDWELVRNGESVWLRTESLGGVVAAAWAELSEMKDLARELEVEGHQNVVQAYIHRVKRHLRDLQHLPAWLQRLPSRILGNSGDSVSQKDLVRDSFGFRKLVIVATDNGRLLALDTGKSGAIVYNVEAVKLDLGAKWDVKALHVQDEVITVIDASGHELSVETLTGKVIESKESQKFVKATAFIDDASHKKRLLPIYENEELGDEAAVVDGTITVVIQEDGTLRGVRYSANSGPQTSWEFKPAPGEEIVGLTSRPHHDPVASIGKVLGDRSVMYKYLNPNLVLVTATSKSTSTATFYILDSVSGDILYSTIHQGVDTSRPIVSAMSENWFTYSLWGDISSATASKGYQLVFAELYESSLPNDRGSLGSRSNFSSISGTITKPHVISQAFVIPEEISDIAVTETRQGITSRQLLCILPSSNAIIGIPRQVLDPRRPIDRDPTAAEVEEGLSRYAPVIGFDPRWITSHKREVVGAKKILTSPALLESTSLVFAYGGDVFGTRVAPSMAFDILGKEFGKVQLLGTVFALAVGVAVLAPMVRRKQINAQWQS
ncbi:MAG: hypothetical protein M1819_004599 [Sarea resinae]|nr:MAG: hypothetical protein M1819_006798 [Sarea resinae]KAI9828274.1 MAG: hypothetical protein M1819_006612 [Sarea resinae]KAI9832055.1 MAG: hypothetical protein M1819_004599 [Sarea resinae]